VSASATRERCRAACGRGCAGAFSALQIGKVSGQCTRQNQGPNVPGRGWNDLSPLSPLVLGLSPLPTGTDFINVDNGLRAFFGFVPAVPAEIERVPEADTRKARPKTHRQPAARVAWLALVGGPTMARSFVQRYSGARHFTGEFGGTAGLDCSPCPGGLCPGTPPSAGPFGTPAIRVFFAPGSI